MRTNGSQGPIDIVTTALRRVDILKLTYDSFLKGGVKNLPPIRLIVNVDPLGNDQTKDIEDLIRVYTSNYVLNFSEQPNFSKAVRWCLSNVSSNMYIHLEDDWILNKPIDFLKWKTYLVGNNLAQCALAEGKARSKSGLCTFRPHLAHKYCSQIYSSLDLELDPEKAAQLHYSREGYLSKDYPIDDYVIGTGRKWAKYNGLRKRDHPVNDGGVVDNWFTKRRTYWFVGAEYFFYKLALKRKIKTVNK